VVNAQGADLFSVGVGHFDTSFLWYCPFLRPVVEFRRKKGVICVDVVNFDAVANSIATVYIAKNYEKFECEAMKKFKAVGGVGDSEVFIARELQGHFAVAYETAFSEAIQDSELWPQASFPGSDDPVG